MKIRVPGAGVVSGGLRKVSVVAFAVIAVAAVGLSGCTIDRDQSAGAAESNVEADDNESQVSETPEISVKDGATDVDPSTPITVKAGEAKLQDVVMTNEAGYEVESELNNDRTSWSSAETLGYNRTYTVKATDAEGETVSSVFTTVSPSATTSVALSPIADSVVGVGQTIAFRFGTAIQDRQAAQDAITITTSPKVEGQFYWLNNQEVRWRPADYWEPGTSVTVEADIYGTNLGGGTYGQDDNATNFTIGDRVEAVVDDATKTMDVYSNGSLLRSIPVSLGRSEWATPNGVYIIGDRHESLVMDSSTFGLSEENGGYVTPVDYATQMSYSGIYVHAAPWSVWAQGSQNASHGCVNVTTEAAQWFQNTVKRGDIVTVKNTIGGTLSGYDGLGDWNIPWSEWSKGNVNETSSW